MNLSFEKSIPSNPELIPEVDDFIISKIKDLDLNSDVISNLSLALSEGLSNAMVHGNKLSPDKIVTIKFSIDSDKLKISIKDEGEGFDPSSIPDPTKPENILRDSGRGIHIMKSFMSNINYKFDDSGTELILEIDLPN